MGENPHAFPGYEWMVKPGQTLKDVEENVKSQGQQFGTMLVRGALGVCFVMFAFGYARRRFIGGLMGLCFAPVWMFVVSIVAAMTFCGNWQACLLYFTVLLEQCK